MIKAGFLLILMIGSFGLTQAQRQPGQEPCATMALDSMLRQQFPALGTHQDFENWLSRQEPTPSGLRQIYTIPVVVHVVHDGEAVGAGTNLIAARVQSQLDVLNEDFRRMAGTPGFNSDPVGSDIEVEFCLATVNPDGQTMVEPGIDRVDRNVAGFNEPPYTTSYIRNTVLPDTYWDPNRYMNIWTVAIENDVIGFAQLPSQSTLSDLPGNYGPETTDGVVINVATFGRDAGLSPPYNGGRTTTHEVGHFLGLWHIWGDGNCNADDYCEDTPTASEPHYGCPATATTCSTPDMVTNYMDYLDDGCMNTFTQCQKQRMRTVLENAPRRASLLTSNVCQGQLPPLPDFRASQSRACSGQAITFFDRSNYGPTSWSWSFPGGTPATSNLPSPEVVYPQPGTYDVTLTVSNALGSETLTRPNLVQVNPAGEATLIFAEGFESGQGDWKVENPDGATGWEIKAVEGNHSSFAAGIELYFYGETEQRDAFISPTIDLAGYEDLVLSFEYAYRPFANSSRDSLLVLASVDNGLTYPIRLYGGGQGGSVPFNTGGSISTSFVPAAASDWCGNGAGAECPILDLSALQGYEQVRLRFESYNDYGNNLYFDNVEIRGTCSATTTQASGLGQMTQWRIFPNPSQGQVQVQPPATQQHDWVGLRLYTATGRVVLEQRLSLRQGEGALSLGHLPAGYYWLELLSDRGPVREKLILR